MNRVAGRQARGALDGKRMRSLTDTSLEAEAVQVALFRRASAAKRIGLLRSLSRTATGLSRRAIAASCAGGGEPEASLAFISLNYGAEVAEALREHLHGRGGEKIEMSPPDILTALGPVVDAFEQLGVAYHIGGSLASSAHGIPRMTVDVDLVAELRPEHVRPFAARLREEYYIDELTVGNAVARRGSFNLIHLATMLKVDVFIPKGRAFDREAASRAAPQALEEAEGARAFYLASPEDVILAKLEWYCAGGGVSERQWNDVLGVMRVKAGALDLDYLGRWAGQLGLSDLIERALAEASPGRE